MAKDRDYIDKIKARLEENETKQNKEREQDKELAEKVVTKSTVKVLNYSPADPFKVPNPEKDKVYLFGNASPEARTMSSAQGWRPTKRNGKEVRVGDTILLEMPKRQHRETLLQPLKEKRARKKRAVQSHFENSVSRIRGVTPEGDIDYD